METTQTLRFSGVGFLKYVAYEQGRMIANIQLIRNDKHCRDAVSIKCFIPRKWAGRFNDFKKLLMQGNYIILSFSARYLDMHLFHGSAPDDAQHRYIVFNAELEHLDGVYVNGDGLHKDT